MRLTLAWVALAVTLMITLSFLLPLGVLIDTQARSQRITAAEQRAAALAPVLALTTDSGQLTTAMDGLDSDGTLGVRLPDGRQLGPSHAPDTLLTRAAQERESITQNIPGGWVYLQPVVLPQDRVAVIEEYISSAQLSSGVTESWGIMALLALGLIAGSMLVADRLGAQVVRSTRRLSTAADHLGTGDLATRVEPIGPPELRRAALAFNAMADRIVELLAIERELVADLSHRLRTPMTALHLTAERMGSSTDAQRVTTAVRQLETELNAIIAAARTPLATSAMGRAFQDVRNAPVAAAATTPQAPVSQAAEVIRHRAGFWSTLAGHQDRPCQVLITCEPTPVALPEDDLAAVVDAMIGNVFRHTPHGTAFLIEVARTAHTVLLTVDDAGPGIADAEAALARGTSRGSTGLGLDIALRAAAATGGDLHITRSELGGARIALSLGLATPAPGRRRARAAAGARRLRRGRSER
ncbi:sensor histidine kinase [Streptacidiphilus rugosus]|uniref:sensor histidine kinase n=1 Tax=Streptacidiphilus rugosus TaxID=405783 RepID=UPI00055C2784|nr:HAMP domain-containing sensor histidine kinase [Streptacidiphilus rugosus]